MGEVRNYLNPQQLQFCYTLSWLHKFYLVEFGPLNFHWLWMFLWFLGFITCFVLFFLTCCWTFTFAFLSVLADISSWDGSLQACITVLFFLLLYSKSVTLLYCFYVIKIAEVFSYTAVIWNQLAKQWWGLQIFITVWWDQNYSLTLCISWIWLIVDDGMFVIFRVRIKQDPSCW